MSTRTPDQIRDESMARFNQVAPVKYDVGQNEHGGHLDENVNFTDIEYEAVDFWHYIQSLKHKYEPLLEENKTLRRRVAALEEMVKR